MALKQGPLSTIFGDAPRFMLVRFNAQAIFHVLSKSESLHAKRAMSDIESWWYLFSLVAFL